MTIKGYPLATWALCWVGLIALLEARERCMARGRTWE
jgi:hypothetical protein